MVVPDVELMLGSFQVVAPLFQGTDDGEHLLVCHRIVPFFWTHGVRGEGDRIPLVIFLDREDCASCEVQGVCFKPELTVVIWVCEDRSSGEMSLQTCERVGFRTAPSEDFVFLRKIREGFCQCGVVFDETSIEVG